MRESERSSKLELLILARLSVRAAKRPSEAQVAKSLHAMLARRFSALEWREAQTQALRSLRQAGLVAQHQLALTPLGRARLKAALGREPVASSWRELKTRYLPALLFTETRVSAGVDPRLAVLAQRLGVAVTARSSPESLLHAWMKQELGIRGALSLDEVGCALLARELGLRPRQAPAAVLRQSVTRLSGALKDTPEAVADALTERWLFAEQAKPVATPSPSPSLADDAFVTRAVAKIAGATHAPSARPYGPNKVFIASVWESLASDPELCALGEQGFKALVVKAHRRGLLDLSRADLVAAMDPRDVAASETRHRNATYHFIARGASA
jgi:hypothetical protein